MNVRFHGFVLSSTDDDDDDTEDGVIFVVFWAFLVRACVCVGVWVGYPVLEGQKGMAHSHRKVFVGILFFPISHD